MAFADNKKAVTPNIKFQREKDHEMVKGIFKNYETPGGWFAFSFKKYKEDPVTRYELMDGEIYTIPRMVARHIANDLWYPVHSYFRDEDGTSQMRVGQKVHRAGFQSLEFSDIDEVRPSIVTVEKVPATRMAATGV